MESSQKLDGAPALPTFESLLTDTKLIASLAASGITTPTPVQALAIPRALLGRDLLVEAQTGSGKTLAFVLPILEMLAKRRNQSGTKAVIITPTRELALQICSVISGLAPEVHPTCAIGGDSLKGQIRSLETDRRIVVGTPGRILDLIERRELLLRNCEQFVLDEADEMLSIGFVEAVRAILKRLPPKRQGMFFSATLSHQVSMFAQSFLKNTETIEIKSTEIDSPKVSHLYRRVLGGVADKCGALCDILSQENPSSTIIFCNTKSDTETLQIYMRRRGLNGLRINSDLSQKERTKVLDELRAGNLRYLIATDIAARGIDVENLELVVNYSVHSDSETYVHRTGRTGRAGKAGKAISLVTPQDLGLFHSLQRSLKLQFDEF